MGLGSGIRDLGSGIRKKAIPDPGSRGQKGTGSRIRIRNTEFVKIYFLCSGTADERPERPEQQRCETVPAAAATATTAAHQRSQRRQQDQY